MDYSLLVGVHNLDIAAKERTVSQGEHTWAESFVRINIYSTYGAALSCVTAGKFSAKTGVDLIN